MLLAVHQMECPEGKNKERQEKHIFLDTCCLQKKHVNHSPISNGHLFIPE